MLRKLEEVHLVLHTEAVLGLQGDVVDLPVTAEADQGLEVGQGLEAIPSLHDTVPGLQSDFDLGLHDTAVVGQDHNS